MQARRYERLEFVQTLLAADKASISPQWPHGLLAPSLCILLEQEIITCYNESDGEGGEGTVKCSYSIRRFTTRFLRLLPDELRGPMLKAFSKGRLQDNNPDDLSRFVKNNPQYFASLREWMMCNPRRARSFVGLLYKAGSLQPVYGWPEALVRDLIQPFIAERFDRESARQEKGQIEWEKSERYLRAEQYCIDFNAFSDEDLTDPNAEYYGWDSSEE